jgi:hypothetical protein
MAIPAPCFKPWTNANEAIAFAVNDRLRDLAAPVESCKPVCKRNFADRAESATTRYCFGACFFVFMQFITLSTTLKRTIILKLRLHICGVDTVFFDKLSKSPTFLASQSRGLRDIAACLAHDLHSVVMLEGM